VTLFQRGYWKLKQLHHINQVYEQVNGNLLPFLELYELARKDGLSTEQVLKAVKIADGKLPYIESRYKEFQNQVYRLEYKTQTLQDEIITQKQVLESYNRYCNKQKQEIENLYTLKKQLAKFRHTDGRYS
jgi:chromosome segregation ATPase